MSEPALPDVDPPPLAAVHDDDDQAPRRPLRPRPVEEIVDHLTAELKWQETCEEISAHGGLAHPYTE
ncbi:MAG: hypothetical protein ACRDPG_06120 [Nocardioidaceae bacterium]